ncbi:MAG: NAD(P)/FAD-dependent oxidoreductase, partial [Xenococcaceae cyanobacterium]
DILSVREATSGNCNTINLCYKGSQHSEWQGLAVLNRFSFGAHPIDLAADLAWLTPAGWGVRFPSELTMISGSRSLLEWCIRQRVSALPQIEFLQGCEVKSLVSNEDNTGVVGVLVDSHNRSDKETTASKQFLFAQLVVDASGRSSQAPQWLDRLGYTTPQKTVVNPHLGYASRLCQLPSDLQWDWRALYLQPDPPNTVRGGAFYPLEENRWIITLWGSDRDYPPTDEAGFLKFARSLPSPLLYEAIAAADPISPIYGYRATENRLWHYEKLARWPEGFVILGDAVCAFNPLYAQGMTVAALGALTLEQCLQEQIRCRPDGSFSGMARRFQKQLAQVNAAPWQLAITIDYQYRSTVGGSPNWSLRLMYRYMKRVLLLATKNVRVRRLLLEVFNLLQPPTILFRPHIVIQVFAQVFKKTSSPVERVIATNESHLY